MNGNGQTRNGDSSSAGRCRSVGTARIQANVARALRPGDNPASPRSPNQFATFIPMSTYEVHPLANLMTETDLDDVTEDIPQHGQREPIKFYPERQLIDRRNCEIACRRLGIEPNERTIASGNDTPEAAKSSGAAVVALQPTPAMTEVVPKVFDYASLSAGLTENLHKAADTIRVLLRQQQRAIIETGRGLLTVREELKHGQFLRWIEAEFQMTNRTAQRYMSVARLVGGKIDTVSHLTPNTLYQLAAPSTPDPVKVRVMTELGSGKVLDDQDVKSMIAAGKLEHSIFMKTRVSRRKLSLD